MEENKNLRIFRQWIYFRMTGDQETFYYINTFFFVTNRPYRLKNAQKETSFPKYLKDRAMLYSINHLNTLKFRNSFLSC
jgi:hypothetical protein